MKLSDGKQASNSTAKIRVILVEDHPILRAGVATLLRDQSDLELIGEAGNGLDGVQLAQRLQPDVVIMDVSLPELGGAEATRQIKAARPVQRILALSAHEDAAFVRNMLDAGAAGYALKRSACDELVRAVRIVSAGGSYLDPSLPLPDASPGVSLSEREAEVIRLNAQGFTSKEIAETLKLSPRTLETYKYRAMAKLNLGSRAELIRYAARCGWLRDS